MPKKALFIGGALSDAQYLFTLPIVSAYCKSKKIKKIIFEKKLSDKIIKNKVIQKIIEDFEIEYINLEDGKISNIIKVLFFQFYKIIYLYYKIIFFKQIKNFLLNQYVHAIWDTSLRSMSDNQIKPNFFQILKSIIKILITSNYSKKILSRSCHTAFMGHNVYNHKIICSELINAKINVYCQANYSFCKLDMKQNFWGTVTFKELNKIRNIKNIKKYFEKRELGKGNYEDTNLAVLKRKKSVLNNLPKNIIFLHIFRDSPFGVVDNTRIFKDYFEWIKHTIKIIEKSDEKWLLKIHPSTQRWGEDSTKILKNLIEQNHSTYKNIIISKNSHSNINLLRRAKRVITFKGTSHLEAIAYGLKPIIISRSTISGLDKKLFYKPKNLNEYEKLLLKKNKFKILSKHKMYFARKIIYLIENYKSFIKDIDVKNVYTNDSRQKKNEEFLTIEKNLNKNIKYFYLLGKNLANGDKFTYSKSFYDL